MMEIHSRTFSMESSKGYCRRHALPKIDIETGRAEYIGEFPEALASFGVATNGSNVADAQAIPPNHTGKSQKSPRKQAETLKAGEPTLVTRPYPFGKRLLKPARNLAAAHAPTKGRAFFILGLE